MEKKPFCSRPNRFLCPEHTSNTWIPPPTLRDLTAELPAPSSLSPLARPCCTLPFRHRNTPKMLLLPYFPRLNAGSELPPDPQPPPCRRRHICWGTARGTPGGAASPRGLLGVVVPRPPHGGHDGVPALVSGYLAQP